MSLKLLGNPKRKENENEEYIKGKTTRIFKEMLRDYETLQQVFAFLIIQTCIKTTTCS